MHPVSDREGEEEEYFKGCRCPHAPEDHDELGCMVDECKCAGRWES